MKVFTIILLILLTFSVLSAQETLKWTKIVSPKGDLALLVPGDFLVDNEDKLYRIYAYQDEVRIGIEVENGGNAKSRIQLMRQFPSTTEADVKSFSLGDFIGDTYAFGNRTDEEENFSMSVYMASSKAYYRITVSSKIKNNSVLEKFLYSIRLNNVPLLKQENPASLESEKSVSMDSLETSPVVLESLRQKDAEKTKIRYEKEEENKKIIPIKYSRPLILLRKPRPNYTTGGRENREQGKVRLRVVFLANGQIGDIIVLEKLKGGLTEEAVKATRKIKFVPAEIDGKAVDSSRVVMYQFTIY